MCQLTFINTTNLEFNKTYLLNQFLINTMTSHKDGWGFFTETEKTFKTKLDPWTTLDIGEIIGEKIKNQEPILAHVRLASYVHNVKEVTNKNSHPFETKDFVLAHNGKLEGEIIDDERFKENIDSEIFVLLLQETYEKFPKRDAYKIIKDVYDKYFTGKFAFLIYFKPTKKYYICVGKTAKLHKTDIYVYENENKKKKIGYLINTDAIDLDKAFKFSAKNIQMNFGITIIKEETKALEENSIYIANSTFIRKVDEIIETVKVVKTTYTTAETPYTPFTGYKPANTTPYNAYKNIPPKNSSDISFTELADFLINLTDTYGLSSREIDFLFTEITGLPLICGGEDSFKEFNSTLIPILKCHTKHKGGIWKKIVQNFSDPIEAYIGLNLQFPYFMNDTGKLNNTWIQIKQEMESSENVKNLNK